MYDINPFEIARKYFAENKDVLNMKPALQRKREDHIAMVRNGTLTHAEFDRLERNGEFDMNEGEDYDIQTDEQDPDVYEQQRAHEDHERSIREKILAYIQKSNDPELRGAAENLVHADIKPNPSKDGYSAVRVPMMGGHRGSKTQFSFDVHHDSDKVVSLN